jgi:enoyl-CoA hydratase
MSVLLVEASDGVMTLTLNRPDKHNALNRELGSALAEALGAADADEGVSVVVLTGAGEKAFCAGADMGEQLDPQTRGGAEKAIAAATSFSKPLIGAINGVAYGGGALLAAACDVRYGCGATTFKFLGATYGLVVGGSHLPRIIGEARAKELLFTARTVAADEAASMGLLNAIFAGELLLAETHAVAKTIAANSLAALVASKRVIDAALPLDGALQMEAGVNRELRGSEDQARRFGAAAARVLKREEGPV